MCHLTRYYEAECGWVTGVVGSQLGSQLGYPATPANSPEFNRKVEAAAGTPSV
jgi:hypothetical protein